MPGGANCVEAACTQVPAVATSFASGYGDPWLTLLGVISQPTANYNYDRDGNALPEGEPVRRKYAADEYEFYVQDSWRLRSNLTVTAGIRYSLYSPPYEVNGLQVAPTVSMGQWFRDRADGMLRGVPSNQSPMVTFDLAGPKNGKRGFYEMDKNNWAPRLAIAWTPQAQGGVLGWLTGGDRMVVRGGYSKVFDRIGQGLALNFDNGFAFGMSTSISSPFGAPYETNPAVRFSGINVMPPTMPAAPAGGFPQTPPSRAGIITTSIDDTLVTPSAHMVMTNGPSTASTISARLISATSRFSEKPPRWPRMLCSSPALASRPISFWAVGSGTPVSDASSVALSRSPKGRRAAAVISTTA